MPGDLENEFHDPVVKQAVRRCWSCECASVALRARVVKLLEESNPRSLDSASPRRISRLSWMIWPAAVAALLLLSVGLFNHFRTGRDATNADRPITLVAGVNESFEDDLIARHEECCAMPSHQQLPGVAINEDGEIVKAFHATLHQPVIMFHPADKAWVFKGAAVCPVGRTDSAHLVFARDGGGMSVFSLPTKVIGPVKNGYEYSATYKLHNIVAFVKDNALFCIVCSGQTGGPDLQDLKKMEPDLESSISIAQTPPRERVVLTELLRPIR